MLPHLYIYSPDMTGRFQWLVNTFFGRWLQVPYELISDAKAVPEDAIVLSYAERMGVEQELHIAAHPEQCVLNERITSEPPLDQSNGELRLYPVQEGDFPVDIFSAAVFCMGRMEEYDNPSLDEHGRFAGRNAHASRHDYLRTAIIDRYFQRMYTRLETFCNDWSVCLVGMQDYHPTIDVDAVWAFQNKRWTRIVGGLLKSLLYGRFDEARKRVGTLFGQSGDPFDTFSRLHNLHERYDLDALFFVLSSESSSYDPQNALQSPRFQSWLNRLSQQVEIGLHPGYESFDSVAKLKQDRSFLEKSLGRTVDSNRFHYLRFHLPEAYRNLIEAGIQSDYSMGYADRCGFRAGTARPYAWYDMEREEETVLTIYPFQVMDTTLNKYLKSSPKEAINLMKNLYIECRTAGGTFRTLWHNSSLSELGPWKYWSDVYARWLYQYDHILKPDY